MPTEVKIPSVGESITSGLISAWSKSSGDYVKAGETLLTLETDKISTEIAAETAGRLDIKVDAGQEVKIGQVVAVIDETAQPTAKAEAAPVATAPSAKPAPVEAPAAGRIENVSPAVRRLLEENKISPADVMGSGKEGRITKGDVLGFIESRPSSEGRVQPPSTEPAPVPPPSSAVKDQDRTSRKRLTPLRRKIAEQLVMAQQTAAILTTFNECDMSAVMAMRAKVQERFQKKHGLKLGFMSFFVKAAVDALKTVPGVNSRIEGDEIVEHHYYDIGVAVSTEKGLVVPVIRDADRKSFAEIEKDLADYATRAREGKIKIEELQGGVFTVSNGGVFGSLLSTPILNPPQSGILGMHATQERPVVRDGQIVIRPMMYLALSYDHRVVDGREAVTFLVRIKECVEDPSRLLFEA